MKKVKTLKKNYEFKNVLEKGKYSVNKQIIVYARKNKLGYNRIGIAIGSKLGHAVTRNHLKRLIREAYYNNMRNNIMDNEENSCFYDFVVIWNKKSNVEDASFNCINNDFSMALKRLKNFN